MNEGIGARAPVRRFVIPPFSHLFLNNIELPQMTANADTIIKVAEKYTLRDNLSIEGKAEKAL